MKKFLIFLTILYILIIFILPFEILSINFSPFGEGTKGAILNYHSQNIPLFFYNPSNSSNDYYSERSGFTVFYEHKFLFTDLSSYNSFVLNFPEIKNMNIGVQIINQSIDGIPIYPEYDDSISFVPEGYFSDNCYVGLLNFSYRIIDKGEKSLYEMFFGGNIKTILHRIYTNRGTGIGMDLGTTFRLSLDNLNFKLPGIFSISFVCKDVGETKVIWDTDSNTVSSKDANFIPSLGYEIKFDRIKSKFFSEVTYNFFEKTIPVSIIYSYSNLFGIFAGYEYQPGMDFDLNQTGVGVYLNLLKFSISYSFTLYDIGYTNSLGLSYIF